MTTEQIMELEFESLKNDLIKEYDALGMRASGKFADELVVEVGIDNVKLIGEKYAEQLEYGRRGGKFPPIQMSKQWIKDKGIVSNINLIIIVNARIRLVRR